MFSFWQCLERWLLHRRDAFVNKHLQAANAFVVMDADTLRLMQALERGGVAKTTRFPKIDEKFGNT